MIAASATAPLTLAAGAADAGTLRVTLDSGQLGSLGQTTASASVPVAMASDRQNSKSMTVDMSTDTGAYASADLIADTQQFDGFFNKTDGSGVINSITLYDYADNTAFPCYVVFHKTTTSMGTENSAPNISDANARDGIFGYVMVAASDWLDIGGLKIATVKNIGLPVTAVSGTDDLYCSIVNGTLTPTFGGGTLGLTVGALLD
jgi:hypothetical protein